MADAARTLAALQALLADNTTGDASPQDIRDFLLSVLSGYGTISTISSLNTQGSITTAAAKVTGFDVDGQSASDVTPDHTDDSITVTVAGKYKVEGQFSFAGTASKTFRFRVRVNGVESTIGCSRKLGTGGDVGSCGLNGILDLAASDIVTVYVDSTDGGVEIIVHDAQLTLTRVE